MLKITFKKNIYRVLLRNRKYILYIALFVLFFNWFSTSDLYLSNLEGNSNDISSETQKQNELKNISNSLDSTVEELPTKSETFLVTRVIDGDTIAIEGGQKVRYIGVDTPETVNPNSAVECYGLEASNKNKELVAGKRVKLEKDVSETDKYGRLLRYVWVDETFVNDYLVKEGYANSVTYQPDIKYQSMFKDSETSARSSNKGLWDFCD